jgi:hypothetical protein
MSADPLGECWFCFITKAYNAVNSALNAALSWAEGYTQSLECQQWGLAQSRLAGILGCAKQASESTWLGAASIIIPSTQFGKKVGKHAEDWGYDVRSPADREKLEHLIRDIASRPDEVRIGPWHPRGGGGEDYIFYRQGPDVVVADENNVFVTILKNGSLDSRWFREARPVPKSIYEGGVPGGEDLGGE